MVSIGNVFMQGWSGELEDVGDPPLLSTSAPPDESPNETINDAAQLRWRGRCAQKRTELGGAVESSHGWVRCSAACGWGQELMAGHQIAASAAADSACRGSI